MRIALYLSACSHLAGSGGRVFEHFGEGLLGAYMLVRTGLSNRGVFAALEIFHRIIALRIKATSFLSKRIVG